GFVNVVVDVEDYDVVLAEMAQNEGHTTYALRQRLAQTAYARTAAYDTAVSTWMAGQVGGVPRRRSFGGALVQTLRYGENPHQAAAFYTDGADRPGVATAVQHQGKELSYNNLNDTDAAYELIGEFDPDQSAAVAIIKHANPCGVAQAKTLIEAYDQALLCDPVSVFGGIVAMNRIIDGATAERIIETFTEVVIAPSIDEDARRVFEGRANLRVLTTSDLPDPRQPGLMAKTIAGGFLVQSRDIGCVDDLDLRVVTDAQPTAQQMTDLVFAFRVAKHVKSNAIVFAKNSATVGIGAGQMSRIDSTHIASRKAQDASDAAGLDTPLIAGSVVASDAFFPFADGVLAAADAGATAVIQPGGSKRDDEVIEAANARGLAMVFTGMRHFKH
ncbi:MAG: bifunctional phosphoribosylaminoimidazolecarboxamide formyltransferase/IMP cyclohydrolase, partial [Pseudomonadota bacterium]